MKKPYRLREDLGIDGKIVLCYSGGIDSLIGSHYLDRSDALHTDVYFNLGSRYSAKEYKYACKAHQGVTLDDSLAWLGITEVGEKAFIPYRNLYLAMTASIKYAPNVCICGLKDDVVEDKNEQVFLMWSRHLSEIGREDVKIFSPFWGMTKDEIVAWYLANGGSLKILENLSVSCYNPIDSNYCGKCPSCFRKWVALKNAGSKLKFYNKQLASEYYLNCLKGKYDKQRRNNTIKVLQNEYGWRNKT